MDPQHNYSQECAGHPIPAPTAWMFNDESLFESRRAGLSNQGHAEGIFLQDGKDLLSSQDKKDLIVFLKSL